MGAIFMLMRTFEAEFDAIETAQSLDSLHAALRRIKSKLGFEHYAFSQANVSRTDGLLIQDCPDSWIRLISETFAYTRSPILLAGSIMPAPFVWADLPQILTLSEEQLRYLEMASEHGLAFGFTVPLHAPGEPSAVVSFVNGKSRPLNRESLPMAMYTASRAFLAGRRIKRATAEHGLAISDGDRRVITYLCRGMSRTQIARKLGTDIKAINAVIIRGCKHYEVGSQTELVVRTLFEQAIRFEDVIH